MIVLVNECEDEYREAEHDLHHLSVIVTRASRTIEPKDLRHCGDPKWRLFLLLCGWKMWAGIRDRVWKEMIEWRVLSVRAYCACESSVIRCLIVSFTLSLPLWQILRRLEHQPQVNGAAHTKVMKITWNREDKYCDLIEIPSDGCSVNVLNYM